MSETGIAAFDTTVQKTNLWLGDLMVALETTDRQRAYRALSATLHALRDHLPIHQVIEVSQHLPTLVRGMYFEGWNPSPPVKPSRTLEAFLAPIHAVFRDDHVSYAERAARAVFAVITDKFNEGEVQKLKGVLPADIRALWPSSTVGRRDED